VNIDTKVLDLDAEYILSKAQSVMPVCGIYFLIKDNEIVYVGKSKRISYRLNDHKRVKDFNRVFFIECNEEDLDEVERTYIRKFLPKLNIANNYPIHRTHGVIRLEPIEYDGGPEITSVEFHKVEERYEAALQARREAMLQQYEDLRWTQKQIAQYWGLDVTRVNRIIKKGENVPT
jgi:hypothetical protein